MEVNIHPVVRLLVARMESHPEEFSDSGNTIAADYPEGDRWWRALSMVREYGSEEEREIIQTQIRVIRLNNTHEWVLDELLNGEDRRRAQRQEEEYKIQQYQMQKQAYATQASPYIQAAGALQNSTGASGLSGTRTNTINTLSTAQPGYIDNLRKAPGL